MAIETVGKYQIHLMAMPSDGNAKYAPYVTISRFDDEAQDFRVVVEKARAAGDHLYDTENQAEEAAREYANFLIEQGLNHAPPYTIQPDGEPHAHHTRTDH
jgi:hypothetical protein